MVKKRPARCHRWSKIKGGGLFYSGSFQCLPPPVFLKKHRVYFPWSSSPAAFFFLNEHQQAASAHPGSLFLSSRFAYNLRSQEKKHADKSPDETAEEPGEKSKRRSGIIEKELPVKVQPILTCPLVLQIHNYTQDRFYFLRPPPWHTKDILSFSLIKDQ